MKKRIDNWFREHLQRPLSGFGPSRKFFSFLGGVLLRRHLKRTDGGYKASVGDETVKLVEVKDFRPLRSEPEFGQEFAETVENGDVVADIGAYHGFYTAVAAGKAEKVYTFEIDPANIEHLEKNLELNGTDNVETVERAAWDLSGGVRMEGSGGGSNQIGSGEGRAEAVELDELFTDETVDVIKMDIEGAEYRALKGGENLISREKPVIFIEVHGESYLENFDHSPEDVLNLLENLGYRTEKLEERGDAELVKAVPLDG